MDHSNSARWTIPNAKYISGCELFENIILNFHERSTRFKGFRLQGQSPKGVGKDRNKSEIIEKLRTASGKRRVYYVSDRHHILG